MQSLADDRTVHITQIALAACGALCVLGFLFAPLLGHWASAGSSMYMVEGHGEQWGLLLLALLAAGLSYRRLGVGAAIATGVLLLVALATAWRCYDAAQPITYSNMHEGSAYELPDVAHWLMLALGVGLLLVVSGWAAWQAWSENYTVTQPAGGTNPRSFDPRSRNPQADFGFCSVCGTKNPLALTRCHQCRSPLPWAAPSSPARLAPATQSSPSARVPRTSPLAAVDWGYWGIALLSLLFWPLGLLLFFAYSRNGDDKGNAAIIGAGLGLLCMALRFVATMSRVGS